MGAGELLLVAAGGFGFLAMAAIYLALHFKAKHATLVIKQKSTSELIANLAEGVYRSSLEGKQLSANQALVALNGYDSEDELLTAVDNIATEWYVEPGRREEFSRQLKEEDQITDFVSEIYRHKTRERIWISENARLVRHVRTGEPLYYEGTVREITNSVTKAKSDELLQNLTDKLPHGLFRLVRHSDRTFSCPYVSARFREMTNLSEENEFDALVFANRVHPEDRVQYTQALRKSRLELVDWQCEFRFQWPNGEYHWYHLQAAPERCSNGDTVWHGYVSNIDERRSVEAKVHKLAYFDQLTNLPNRTHFVNIAREQLKLSQQLNSFCAVGFIDLDNFKLLNDTHGHSFGDRLLQAVAVRLSNASEGVNIVSRFGGDEFVVMMTNLGSDYEEANARVKKISQQILNATGGDFKIDGIDCQVTMSLGIALCDPTLNLRMGDLLKSADVAMYEVKKSGRNNALIHDQSMLKQVADRYKLQRDIQDGVEEGQFDIVLQPQFDSIGRLLCAETLVRWDHPEHGRIMPSDFIELAEQTGQICKINEWVLERSVEKITEWQCNPALRDISLSVNISPQQMLDQRFVCWIRELVERYDIPHHSLMLELTEHAMARDPDTVEENMRELQKYGIRFSLDDFGTGYSSIARLRQLPFDELKIDGSFVADIGQQEATLSVVAAILDMAKAMGLRTVAEHVSAQNQVDVLSTLGCDMYQGYLFSRPLPVTDFEDLAASSSAKRQPVDLKQQAG